jgi:hypothetical protein
MADIIIHYGQREPNLDEKETHRGRKEKENKET